LIAAKYIPHLAFPSHCQLYRLLAQAECNRNRRNAEGAEERAARLAADAERQRQRRAQDRARQPTRSAESTAEEKALAADLVFYSDIYNYVCIGLQWPGMPTIPKLAWPGWPAAPEKPGAAVCSMHDVFERIMRRSCVML
jgi:hypothetical protein